MIIKITEGFNIESIEKKIEHNVFFNFDNENYLYLALLDEDVEECKETFRLMGDFPHDWKRISYFHTVPNFSFNVGGAIKKISSIPYGSKEYVNVIDGLKKTKARRCVLFTMTCDDDTVFNFCYDEIKSVVKTKGYQVSLKSILDVKSFNSTKEFFEAMIQTIEENNALQIKGPLMSYFDDEVNGEICFNSHNKEKNTGFFDIPNFTYVFSPLELFTVINKIRESTGMKKVRHVSWDVLIKTLFLILKRNPEIRQEIRRHFYGSLILLKSRTRNSDKSTGVFLREVVGEKSLSFDFLNCLVNSHYQKNVLTLLVYVWAVCFEMISPNRKIWTRKIVGEKNAPPKSPIKSSQLNLKKLPLLVIIENIYDF